MSREATNRILEMVENGTLDKDMLIMACLKYMSEDDVRDMAHCNEIDIEDDCDEDDLDNDTMEEDEDPNGDWYDTSNEFL